ncbi:MAG: COX15/CtaA family protein [Proteobacteria bacterium]|nr:COX15/CtaA family protein [Pseudomonadota bacterium]
MKPIDKQKLYYVYIITFILIWFMVMLGGATRLTHSGLSIVEWRPITGIIPPLNIEDWALEFKKYQTSPEFLKINIHMQLEEFKFIYLMEYCHRLLGRLLGLFFMIPLFFMWKKMNTFFKKQSLLILCLGILQGFMGWYMVKSGLINEPYVSPFRLMIHLSLAFVLMGLLVKGILRLKETPTYQIQNTQFLNITATFITVAILYGALVAGHKAGLIYNTFPLMEGRFIPFEFLYFKPFWKNFYKNHATIQWMHRTIALLAFVHVFIFYLKNKSMPTFIWFLLITLQIMLGVLTLIYQVPVFLGTIHQGVGALLFSWTIVILTIYKKDSVLMNIKQD